MNFNKTKLFHAKSLVVALGAGLFLAAQSFAAEMMQKSAPFKGPAPWQQLRLKQSNSDRANR
jgi:hypothetical protein